MCVFMCVEAGVDYGDVTDDGDDDDDNICCVKNITAVAAFCFVGLFISQQRATWPDAGTQTIGVSQVC